jgi:hypothetical protein
MLSGNMKVPISSPKYLQFNPNEYLDRTTKLPYYPYGSYHCEIEKSSDPLINNLFVFQKDSIYTHFDLIYAKELKLKIKHIVNGNKPNCAIYPSHSLINCREIFSDYIEMVLKIENNPILTKESKTIVKLIRNIVLGACGQKNYSYNKPNKEGITELDDDENEIVEITPEDGGDGYVTVKSVSKAQQFKYTFARVGQFITSIMRCTMGRTILSCGVNNIKRCATDSLFSTIPLESLITIGTEPGQFKLVKQGSIKIENRCSFKWT